MTGIEKLQGIHIQEKTSPNPRYGATGIPADLSGTPDGRSYCIIVKYWIKHHSHVDRTVGIID